MAQMHPDMEALLQAREQTNARLGPRGDDPVEARRWWNTYADILGQPHPADMQVHDRIIPTAHLDVPVRVYQPAGKSGAGPCILYMHGGGFMLVTSIAPTATPGATPKRPARPSSASITADSGAPVSGRLRGLLRRPLLAGAESG